jgi:hypothetical protein
VDWLWLLRLALGKLTLLDGDPGLGKSFLALDLCARLSAGRPMPDGTPGIGPANSLVIHGEDGSGDTVLPRLQALDADLDRVFVWHRDLEAARAVGLPSRLAPVAEALERHAIRMLVLDPVMAFLDPSVQTSSDQGVRRALLPLAELAALHRCVVLLVRHLNKTGGARALYRGGGSIGILGMCRSAWLAAPDPTDEGRCVLAQLKNNLAPAQPSLAYQVVRGNAEVATFRWLGPVDWTANALLGARIVAPIAPPRDRAKEFLLEFLQDGPRLFKDVWPAAKRAGLTERTLRRARNELEARSIRVFRDGQTHAWWALKGQEAPSPDPGGPPSLDPWLKPLIEKYPPLPDLDD